MTMPIHQCVTELIGDTPLLELETMASDCGARIFGKAEFCNPGGSVKDRIGWRMVRRAEQRQELTEGTAIVEPTSGNTGIALAMVCAARGYELILTMPDTMSLERRSLLEALGAELVLTPGALGMERAVTKAEALVGQRDNAIMLQQFQNPANPLAHAETTAEEIWRDTEGQIDAIVTGVGTGGTITGVARVLKQRNPDFKAIAVEPAESPVLSGGEPTQHNIQGIGAGFIPDTLDLELVDEIVTVDYETAAATTRRLASTEGIAAGISTGANVAAAIRVGDRKQFEDQRIVTTLCDSGERYLSTPLYR